MLWNITNIRQEHLNSLVRVSGVVTRRTSVFPQLRYTSYDCSSCSRVLGPFFQDELTKEIRPTDCPFCQARGPFVLNSTEVYRNGKPNI